MMCARLLVLIGSTLCLACQGTVFGAVFRLHDGTLLTGRLVRFEDNAFVIAVGEQLRRVPADDMAGILFERATVPGAVPPEPTGAPQAAVPAELRDAKLVVRVDTGAHVDVRAIAQDQKYFPGAQLKGSNVTFAVHHALFDEVFKDVGRRRVASNSGIDPIPHDVEMMMTVSEKGVLQCGLLGGSVPHVLGAFLVDGAARFERERQFMYDFTLSNDRTFDFKPIRLPRSEDYRTSYTTLDIRHTAPATAIGFAYWTCATRGYVKGGARDFRELWERPWQVYNELSDQVTLLKSCLVFRCLDYTKDSAPYTYSLWCPAPRGTSGSRVSASRTFDLIYTAPKATAFFLKAINDNRVTCQVWLDDEMLVNETRVGSWLGRKLRYDIHPKTVKLVVDRPWSANRAYVVVAQLGGVLEAGSCRESVNGTENPPTSYDHNPPPMSLRIPQGWSDWPRMVDRRGRSLQRGTTVTP